MKNKSETRNNQKNSINFVNILSTTIFIALSVYFISQTVRSISLTRQKLNIFDNAKSEVNELRYENVQLILTAERVVTEEYIEKEARNRLNYAKDGETLFVIPEELLEDTDLSYYINTYSFGYIEEVNSNLTNLEYWIEFFTKGI